MRQIKEHNPLSLLIKQGFSWKFQRYILHNDTHTRHDTQAENKEIGAMAIRSMLICKIRNKLKGGETVLGRNNAKHLEQHVNNSGKKIKNNFIFSVLGLKSPHKSPHKEKECFFHHDKAALLDNSPIWSIEADNKKA